MHWKEFFFRMHDAPPLALICFAAVYVYLSERIEADMGYVMLGVVFVVAVAVICGVIYAIIN